MGIERAHRHRLLGSALLCLTMALGAVGCQGGTVPGPPTDTPVSSPRGSGPTSSGSSSSPSADGPVATVRVVTRSTITGTGDVSAVAMAGDQVWVTEWAPPVPRTGDAPVAGRLLGFDAATGADRFTADIGGAPVSVSATGDRVWVANSVGDGRPMPVAANTVDEFTDTGRLLHRYHVDDPIAIVGTGDDAWVLAGLNSAKLIRLRNGLADKPFALTGGPNRPALAVCDGVPYVATDTRNGFRVTRLAADGTLQSTDIDHAGVVALTCATDSVIAVIDGADGGLVPVRFDSPSATAPVGPRYIRALVGTDPLWAVEADGASTRLLPIDPATLTAGAPAKLSLPADQPVLAAATAHYSCLVVGRNLLVLTTSR